MVWGFFRLGIMRQSFLERYHLEKAWHGKVLVMEIYHTAMSYSIKNWTLRDTADYFECSIGLVSENLRLAKEIHRNDRIMKCETRERALRKIR